MIIKTQTLSVSQTAFVLMKELGSVRNWTNFLTDNIRGRQNVAGYTLLPCGRKHDGKAYRPVYAVNDLRAFIDNVKAEIPSAINSPIKTTVLAIDSGKHWTVNKFKGDGSPVAYRSSVGFRRRARSTHLRHPLKVTKVYPDIEKRWSLRSL